MTAFSYPPALTTLILKGEPRAAQNMLVLAMVAGLCGTATAIIAMMALTGTNQQTTVLALLFAIALIMLAVTCRALQLRSATLAAAVTSQLRQQALELSLIANASPTGDEDRFHLAHRLAATPSAIGAATGLLGIALLHATALAAWLLYLAITNSTAAAVILCAAALVGAWHVRRWQAQASAPQPPVSAAYRLIQQRDAVRLNRARAQSLCTTLDQAWHSIEAAEQRTAELAMRGSLLLFATVQLLLGIALFAGNFAMGSASSLVPLATALAVLLAALPLVALAAVLSDLFAANQLAAEWTAFHRQAAGNPAATAEPTPFRTIHLSGVFIDHAKALGPVDLDIKAGQWLILSGPSGAGKTLLLRVLAGLDAPSAGTMKVDGVVLDDAGRTALRARVAAVLPGTTPFAQPLPHRETAGAEIIAMLVALRLDPARFFQEGRFCAEGASSSEAARLSLAGAMLEGRPLLLIDHPALDSDPDFLSHFAANWAQRLTARGTTVVMVSGNPALAKAADLHLRLAEGRIIASAPPAGEQTT